MKRPTRSQIVEYLVDCLGYSEEEFDNSVTTTELWNNLSESKKLECVEFSK